MTRTWPSAPPLDLALWWVMGHTYFASGSSAPADLRGLARWFHPIGVSIPDMSEPVIAEIERNAHLPIPVFVDTGAFSEVIVDCGKVRMVAPISDAMWTARLAVELRLAGKLGPKAYCVAPDRVGDQDETLRRLGCFKAEVAELRARGARVVVPLQRGALDTAAFDRRCAETLDFDDFVRAVPGNKAAMPLVELERFLRAARPAALHVLGMGPRSTRFVPFCQLVQRIAPTMAVSYDSNLIAAHVGASNGRAGAPRFLTAMQGALTVDGSEKTREDAVAMLVGPSMMMARMAKDGYVGLRYHPEQPGLFDEKGTP